VNVKENVRESLFYDMIEIWYTTLVIMCVFPTLEVLLYHHNGSKPHLKMERTKEDTRGINYP
jgi:hypothetical protein